MSDVSDHLENREALLLLYLADELSPQERDELEQRLSMDGLLRADMERLREACGGADEAMRRLDELTAPPVPDGVAIRKVARMMKEWQSSQLQAARLEPIVERSLRFPWWSYPLATAAAVVVALFVWWINLNNMDTAQPYAMDPAVGWQVGRPSFPGGMGFGLGFSSFVSQEYEELPVTEDLWAESLERSFDNSESLLEEAVAVDHLERAENEVLTLWDRRSDFPDALFIQDTDQ